MRRLTKRFAIAPPRIFPIDRPVLCAWCDHPLYEPPPRHEYAYVHDDEPDAPTKPGQTIHHLCMLDLSVHVFDGLVEMCFEDEWTFLSHETGRELLRDLLGRWLILLDQIAARQ